MASTPDPAATTVSAAATTAPPPTRGKRAAGAPVLPPTVVVQPGEKITPRDFCLFAGAAVGLLLIVILILQVRGLASSTWKVELTSLVPISSSPTIAPVREVQTEGPGRAITRPVEGGAERKDVVSMSQDRILCHSKLVRDDWRVDDSNQMRYLRAGDILAVIGMYPDSECLLVQYYAVPKDSNTPSPGSKFILTRRDYKILTLAEVQFPTIKKEGG